MSTKENNTYVYIDDDDNIDSVYAKLEPIATSNSMSGFKILVNIVHIQKILEPDDMRLKREWRIYSVQKTKNGLQSSVNLTIPSVRTVDKLAEIISKKMMMDSLSIHKALTDSATCAKYGYTTQTILCMFIPNTYELYWNISVDKFLEK